MGRKIATLTAEVDRNRHMRTCSVRFCSTLASTLVLLSQASVVPGLAQTPHPFGGITVIESANYLFQAAVGIDLRVRDGRPLQLLLVVAGDRSYASVTKTWRPGRPDCMTWVARDTGTPDQVVLGDGDAWMFTMREGNTLSFAPRMCAEFRLQRLGPKRALFTKGDLRIILPIVASYPIASIDWSDPALSRFRFPRTSARASSPKTPPRFWKQWSAPQGPIGSGTALS